MGAKFSESLPGAISAWLFKALKPWACKRMTEGLRKLLALR